MEKMDFKKEYKDIYFPKSEPSIIQIPKMTYIAVSGNGDPNEKNGQYQKAMQILYGIVYAIKMSKMGADAPKRYFDFVVAPLEGLWDVDLNEITDFGISDKSKFEWISMIRVPDYVSEEVFEWTKLKLEKKHEDIDFSNTKLLNFEEGLCAQIMHIGSFDDEMQSIIKLKKYIEDSGYEEDFDKGKFRYHHEIYLSDFRKIPKDRLKTVIRHPVKKVLN